MLGTQQFYNIPKLAYQNIDCDGTMCELAY